MTVKARTREELLAHVARCVLCGACDTTILTSLETTPDDELADHVEAGHDRRWRSIERRALARSV